MGPCKDCGKWHCVCRFVDELAELGRQRRAQIQEHRLLKAKHDPSFQRFMAKVLNG